MKVAYIAGPYRAATTRGVVENIRKAEAVALKYWLLGYAAICPHMNTRLFDGAAPDDLWLEGDLYILAKCDVIVMMDGWEKSKGATKELGFAQSLGKDVIYDGK
jgi:Domain of unknown function (DUF4406)